MAKAMTKAAIVAHLAEKAELTKNSMSDILDALASLAYKEATNGFTIPGIGKLVLADRKARTGRNPQTGEAISIPAKRVVKFRLSKMCKDGVLGEQ